ncbi:methionyl-tRNA formyltransferase [Blumeria hordei DH14]|uniref:methionyl-tRNA formyltransferase n=1 Tax=Blumeria graminis f. sp. hordei (strain DH14) TaxID=546991 RepID=N1JJG5_BLUG1|nr:methionyl-tRNA formyltransferase [Blumeria hordei DH14]
MFTQAVRLRFIKRAKLLVKTNHYSRSISKVSKPLRILFCGSDDFSVSSLKAVHRERERDPNLIKSIDVLCRPGKPVGRGLKKIHQAPIKAAAEQLGIPLHERDSFRGWQLPRSDDETINLIIAVSFGLFIPARILQSAEYGGLNIHPSILPKGPAPIQHTLLADHRFTGVTLQTLDMKSFDRGIILDQTRPWLEVPDLCTYDGLLKLLTPLAADMLVRGLRRRIFLPPLHDMGWVPPVDQKLIHARKITSADKMLPWNTHDIKSIIQGYRALGRLWSNVYLTPKIQKRLTFDELSLNAQESHRFHRIEDAASIMHNCATVDGMPLKYFVVPGPGQGRQAVLYYDDFSHKGSINMLFKATDISWSIIRVGKITIEGMQPMAASRSLQIMHNGQKWLLDVSQTSRPKIGTHFPAFASP